MTDPRRARLKLLGPGELLTGVAPLAFERASKTCQAGDLTHRGLVRVAAAVADHGVFRVLAPSARPALLEALSIARAWCDSECGLKRVAQVRSASFDATKSVVDTTLGALEPSLRAGAPAPASGLHSHAQGVVRRYVRLSAKLGTDAVVLTLDGITEPERLAQVIQQVSAARAYQATALGAARQPDFLKLASEWAHFESEVLSDEAHPEEQLALLVLHEYLGVRWKVLHDAERAYIDQFVDWVLAGSLSGDRRDQR